MEIEVKIDAFTIEPDQWVPVSAAGKKQPPEGVPVWLKLEGDRIVLSAWKNVGYASGWWVVFFDGKNFVINGSTGYLAKGASWQPFKLYSHLLRMGIVS